MGHLMFFVLHFIAVMFTGAMLLFLTIPLHLIYASSRRTATITEQTLQPEIYEEKQERKRRDRRALIVLAVVILAAPLATKYIDEFRQKDTDNSKITYIPPQSDNDPIHEEPELVNPDEISAEIAALEVVEEIEPLGKWQVNKTINPVDDTPTVRLRLIADSGQSSWRDKTSLHIACVSDTTDLYIDWHDYLGSETSVLTRVGTAQAITKTWSLSTDSRASFYPRKKITFIKTLFGADKLVAQTTPYNENPITATFDIRGLEEAIKPLRTACHW